MWRRRLLTIPEAEMDQEGKKNPGCIIPVNRNPEAETKRPREGET